MPTVFRKRCILVNGSERTHFCRQNVCTDTTPGGTVNLSIFFGAGAGFFSTILCLRWPPRHSKLGRSPHSKPASRMLTPAMEAHPKNKQSLSHIWQTRGAQAAQTCHWSRGSTSAGIQYPLTRLAEIGHKVYQRFHRLLLRPQQYPRFRNVSRPTKESWFWEGQAKNFSLRLSTRDGLRQFFPWPT